MFNTGQLGSYRSAVLWPVTETSAKALAQERSLVLCVCVQDLSLQAGSKLKKQGFLFGTISYLGMNGVIVAVTRLSD